MNTLRIAIVAITVILLSAVLAVADEYVTREEVFPQDSISLLSINADFGAGDLRVRADDIADIARIDIEYDAEKIKVDLVYEKDDDIGFLDLMSKRNRDGDGFDTEDNMWDVVLSTRYSTEFELDLGACRADLDLGGIPIEMINLDVGAAKGILTFGKPNPIKAEKISIDAGAASITMEKLGNANFSHLNFDGGLGKFKLDFDGVYTQKSKAHVSLGMGSAIIHLPADLPIRIEAGDNFLSSIDFKNVDRDQLDDGYYESEDFRSSEISLDLQIEVGLGSVDIIFDD